MTIILSMTAMCAIIAGCLIASRAETNFDLGSRMGVWSLALWVWSFAAGLIALAWWFQYAGLKP